MDSLISNVIGGCLIESKLGQGGMGTVYRATQLSLKRPVAVKFLNEVFGQNQEYIERFKREAQVVAQINHPNIIQIHDLGYDEQRNLTYFIMEYVQGQNLSDIFKRHAPLEQEVAVRITYDVTQALAAAFAQKIIHRDIKPDNIMVTYSGQVKVADFGLAKNTEHTALLTHTGQIMGTPAYLSPEQGEGAAADHRSDIYSLGVTLFQMVTGVLPYQGETPISIVFKHVNAPLPDPRKYCTNLSSGLRQIILKMMAKAPCDRYQEHSALLADLAKILGNREVNLAHLLPKQSSGEIATIIEKTDRRTGDSLEARRASPSATKKSPAQPPAAKTSRKSKSKIRRSAKKKTAAGDPSGKGTLDKTMPLEGAPPGAVISKIIKKFEDLEEIGRGSWAVVYKGRHRELQKDVAIKVFKQGISLKPCKTRKDFRKFLKTLQKLEHPNIATIIGFGEAGHVFYLLSQLLSGPNLEVYLDEQKRLRPEQSLKITTHALSALVAAHRVGLVHNALKPSNIIFDTRGEVRLTDFGLSDFLEFPHLPTLQPPDLLYMSPEKLQGNPEHHQMDIWSLGIIWYQMLCGQVPFPGSNREEILQRMYLPMPPLDTQQVTLAPALQAVLRKMLAPDPRQRYQDARTVLRDIRKIQHKSTREHVSTAPASAPARHVLRIGIRILLVLVIVSTVAYALWSYWQHYSQQRQHQEKQCWRRTQQQVRRAYHQPRHQIKIYKHYLAQWPTGRHAAEAAKAIERIRMRYANRMGNQKPLNYQQLRKQVRRALQAHNYKRAIKLLQTYLDEHSRGPHNKQVHQQIVTYRHAIELERIQQQYSDSRKMLRALQDFKCKHPHSSYVPKASQLIEELHNLHKAQQVQAQGKWQSALQTYQKLLHSLPTSLHEQLETGIQTCRQRLYQYYRHQALRAHTHHAYSQLLHAIAQAARYGQLDPELQHIRKKIWRYFCPDYRARLIKALQNGNLAATRQLLAEVKQLGPLVPHWQKVFDDLRSQLVYLEYYHQAREAFRTRHYQDCMRLCDQALRPGVPKARWRKNCLNLKALAQECVQVLSKARHALEQGQYKRCLYWCRRGLELRSDETILQEWQRQAIAKLQQQADEPTFCIVRGPRLLTPTGVVCTEFKPADKMVVEVWVAIQRLAPGAHSLRLTLWYESRQLLSETFEVKVGIQCLRSYPRIPRTLQGDVRLKVVVAMGTVERTQYLDLKITQTH